MAMLLSPDQADWQATGNCVSRRVLACFVARTMEKAQPLAYPLLILTCIFNCPYFTLIFRRCFNDLYHELLNNTQPKDFDRQGQATIESRIKSQRQKEAYAITETHHI